MNKKTAVALAVGAVFTTPALAQVEIYGRIYPQVTSTAATGTTAPGAAPSNIVTQNTAAQVDFKRRLTVDSSNSRVGFRGREMLGGGLNAIWQIESRTRIDDGTGVWAGNRNSFLGLRGGFGTVKLGNMDTIYKEYGAAVGNYFGISSGNFVSPSNVLSETGLNLSDSAYGDTGFHVRAPNSIQYETPEFGGFQAGVQYGVDETKGNPGNGGLDSNLWSFGVKYEAGPLYVSVQHERHNDWFDGSSNSSVPNGGLAAATGSSRDTGNRISAKYAVTRQHRLTGDFSRMEWKESGQTAAGQFERFRKNSWAVGWEANWGGPWRSEVNYVRADEGSCTRSGGVACSTAGMRGSLFSAGVGYSLSKRTLMYGIAAKLETGASARFDNVAAFNPNRGADTTQVAVGVSHSF